GMSLHTEHWIAVHVNPVGVFRRNVAAEAVFLEIRGYLLVWGIGLVKCPAPTVSPKGITAETSLVVFDHHEPLYRALSPVGVASRQLRVIGPKNLLHQDGSVGKLLVLAIELCGPRRRVGEVHLVAFGIKHSPRAEDLKSIAIVRRLAKGSFSVDESEVVGPAATLDSRA